jgi:hypothetical protein
MGIISGIFIFFMPLFYHFRLLYEVKKNVKLRNEALLQLCNSDPNWIKDDNPIFDIINDAVKPFSFINVLSQELFSINLFENNEPAINSGLKDCKMLSIYNLNHFLELYNKSLLSGFWSLILKPDILLDKNYFKIIALKDKEDISTHIIIIMDFEKEYIRFFQFVINSK